MDYLDMVEIKAMIDKINYELRILSLAIDRSEQDIAWSQVLTIQTLLRELERKIKRGMKR